MPGLPNAARLRAALAPFVASAAKGMGSRVDVHSIVSVAQKDKSYVEVPQLSASDVPIRLRMMTTEQAQEVFGLNSIVTMRGSMARVAEVEIGNVIVVVEGEFLGTWLKVEKLLERPLSDSYVLGLVTTRALS